ncbi:CDP-diacylglycerol--serine O-phosphatidyltransferase [Archaeoglobales archaeon]|nr:MAG: CDP-diacylglycerol--serine O-phosphatidyltransferase [Archaeoglobales archaeon]
MMFKELKIADLFSILNAVFGFGGIVYLFTTGLNSLVFYFLYVSSIMDGADGIAANRFGKSPFGKDLDSLADSISFGVFPAAILAYYDSALIIPSIIFVVTSILRLARFNVVESKNFIGYPTIASALLVTSLMRLNFDSIMILVITILLSYLMISDFEYLKIRDRLSLFVLGVVILSCFVIDEAVYALLCLTVIYLMSPFPLEVIRWWERRKLEKLLSKRE